MASPSRSPSLSPEETPTPPERTVRYNRNPPNVLSDWVDNDATKCCLIEREHAAGREEHAIKFAEYMNGWNRRPQDQKDKYKTKEDFYKYLQTSVTAGANYENRKPDDKTGFSESSCKRIVWEGNCYINLKKSGTDVFPQCQSAAVALFNNTTEKNILEVWTCALDLYGGNKKRVNKTDILTAVERCKIRNIQATKEAAIELTTAKRLLDTSLAKQKELEEREKAAVEKAKDLQKTVDSLEHQHQQTDQDVDVLNVKKRKLLDEFCLGYEDDHYSVPINTEARLLDIFESNGQVHFDCITDEDGCNIVTCNSMEDWQENFYLYALYFNNKKRNIFKGKGKGIPSPPGSG